MCEKVSFGECSSTWRLSTIHNPVSATHPCLECAGDDLRFLYQARDNTWWSLQKKNTTTSSTRLPKGTVVHKEEEKKGF